MPRTLAAGGLVGDETAAGFEDGSPFAWID